MARVSGMASGPVVELRAYQDKAVSHLLRNPHSGLLMDPGTGKTVCTLSSFWVLRRQRLLDALLIVAPLRPAYEVWPAEVEKWRFPFRVSVVHGAKKEDAFDADAEIYVINYDGLRWLAQSGRLRKWLKRFKNGVGLVLDESTKVKHTNTQRFKTLRDLLPLFARRTILTGTPAPNGLLDLFGQVYCVDLGERLGRYITHYRREFFYPTGYGGYSWVPQEGAETRIHERLDGLFYRVGDDVLDLPKLNEVDVTVHLPPDAMTLYQQLERDFIIQLQSGVVTAMNAAVLTSKLRQVANGGLYDNSKLPHAVHAEKDEAIADLIEQLQGNPLLVGYEFTMDAARLKKLLKKRLDLDAPIAGDYSPKQLQPILRDFNAGRVPALIAQTASLAHGLNLQEACHTIALHGLTWDLESYIQFRKRVHRGGQRKPVTVHRVIAVGTVDYAVLRALQRKTTTQGALLDYFKQRSL